MEVSMHGLMVLLMGATLTAGALEVSDEFDYGGVTNVSATQLNFWEVQLTRQTNQPYEASGRLTMVCQDNSQAGPTVFIKHGVESDWNFFTNQIRFTFSGLSFEGTALEDQRRLYIYICPQKSISYSCDDGFYLQVWSTNIVLNIKKNGGLNCWGSVNVSTNLSAVPSSVDLLLDSSTYTVLADGAVVLRGSHGLAAAEWSLTNGTTVQGSAFLFQAKKESTAINSEDVRVGMDRVHIYSLPQNALKYETVYFDSTYGGNGYGTESQPYNSLSALDGRDILEGVTLKLKCGSVFRGGCSPASVAGTSISPVVFEDYGTGNTPVVRGAGVVGGWSNMGDGVWQASVTGAVTGFFIDGERQILARYPNKDAENDGWLKITAKPPTNDPSFAHMLISTNLKDSASWTGSTCVVRAAAWADSVLTVTNWSNTTKTLYFDKHLYADGQTYYVGWGFYLQNVYDELDAEGEWYYNSAESRVYYMKPGTVDLSTAVAEASVDSRGFDLGSGCQFVEFHNLQIDCFKEYGIYGTSVATGVVVDGCTFENNGVMDVCLSGTDTAMARDITVSNSEFFSSAQNCINLSYVDGCLIASNVMDNCYYTPVMLSITKNGTVRGNTIREAGYNGVHISQPISGNLIESNLVDGFCSEFTDGGAYYTWDNKPLATGNPADARTTGANWFKYNIARRGYTEHPANGGSGHSCYGIYLDDNSRLWTVQKNIVVEPGNSGLMLHNARETTVAGNLFYGGDKYNIHLNESDQVGSWWYTQYGTYENMSSNSIVSNVCCITVPSVNSSQTVNLFWQSRYEHPDDMLSLISSNLYYNPFSDVIDIRSYYTNGTALTGGTLLTESLTLADHQNVSGLNIDHLSVKFAGESLLMAEETGENIVPNSDFSGVVETNNCWPRNISTYTNDPAAWVVLSKASGILDGDCLKAVCGDENGSFWVNETAAGNEIAVVSGVLYRVRFTAKASVSSQVDVDVCQDHDSKLPVGCDTSFTVGTNRQDYAYYFLATMTDADARIQFSIRPAIGQIYVDNVTLKEVVVTASDNSAILVNTDRVSAVDFILEDGGYTDLSGTAVSSPVNVPAWSTRVVAQDVNLVTNSGVEGAFSGSGVAAGYFNNSVSATVVFSAETNQVFEGAYAQKINCTAINSGGRVQYNYVNIPVTAGNEYRLSSYMKQTGITDNITLKFSLGAPSYKTFRQEDVAVGTDWKRYAITDYATTNSTVGLFGMIYNSTGTLYVDWVTVKQLYNKIGNWSFEEGACTTTNAADWIRPSFSTNYTQYSAVTDCVSGTVAQKLSCVETGRVQLNSGNFSGFQVGEQYVIKMKVKGSIGTKSVRVDIYARTPDARLEYTYMTDGITTVYQEIEIPFTVETYSGSSSYFTIAVYHDGVYDADAGDYLILDDIRYYHIYPAYDSGVLTSGTLEMFAGAAEIVESSGSAVQFVINGVQDTEGVRILSWTAPAVDLVYTVWSATSLSGQWSALGSITNQTGYVDTVNVNQPVVFYRVTAE
jgi:hypothetical protein